MVCPCCGSLDIDRVNVKDDGQGYWQKEEYICYECDCEWEWKMIKTITKKGKEIFKCIHCGEKFDEDREICSICFEKKTRGEL